MSDLDQIINGDQPEPTEEVTTPQEAPEAEATPDVEAAAEPVQEAPETQKEPHMVPVAVVESLRAELRDLKAAVTPKPEPVPVPDVLEDQQGFQAHLGNQIVQQVTTAKLDISEEMTRNAHGDEVVDAAFQAFQAKQDPALYQSIMSARNPWGQLVKWHQAQTIAQEIGDDPAAYKAKVEAELRQKIEAEMVAKQVSAAAAQPAPSLAHVTGTGGGAPRTQWAGPTPLDAVLK